ncbi:MAG: hypothetical protein CYG59_25665 [Chloroflexi bacterium]|nr:MAG: hypothetical protein CYG59_25665 [Chloroflexota bacterium]
MQLEFIRQVQDLRFPALTFFFEVITSLGGPQFLIVLMPILFWCGSTRVGFRFLAVVLISAYTNSLLKDLGPYFIDGDGPLHTLRPFVAHPQQVWTCRQAPGFNSQAWLAQLCREEESLAFPSGHAQITLVAWGYLARVVRRRWFTIFAVVWVLLVGISRLYLGQHWPTDILGGWLLGSLMLITALGIFSLWQRQPARLNRVLLATLAVLVPVLLLLDNDPRFTRSGLLGVLAGASLGYVLQQRYASFRVRTSWPTQIAKVLIGLLGIAVVQLGLRQLLPDTRVWEVLLGGLTGVWAIYGAPWVFGQVWGKAHGEQLFSQRREYVAD